MPWLQLVHPLGSCVTPSPRLGLNYFRAEPAEETHGQSGPRGWVSLEISCFIGSFSQIAAPPVRGGNTIHFFNPLLNMPFVGPASPRGLGLFVYCNVDLHS